MKELGGDLKNLEKHASTAGIDIRAGFDKLKEVGSRIQEFGRGGLEAFSQSLDAAEEYGRAIAEVSTLVDSATFSTEKMESITLGLAAQFGGTAKGQAKALYQTISAGVTDATKATELLSIANKLAIGGMTDTFTAVDVLTSVTAAYGVENLSAAHASDLLFTTVRLGKTTAAELGATLGRIAPTASAMGVSFDELSAAIAAVTVQGINTAEATTGLKAAMANIIKPTTEAGAAAAKLGIKFDQTALRAKGFSAFFTEIIAKSKGDKKVLSDLFGSMEGMNVALALAKENGKAFNDNLAAMGGVAGATDAAFEKMSATLGFQQDRFKALKNNAMILIGQALEPLLAVAVKFANNVLEWFTKLDKPTRNLIVKFTAFAFAGITLVGGLIALVGTVGGVVAGLSAIGITLETVLAAGLPVVAVLGLLALAGAGLYVAFQKNLGGFRDWVVETWRKVKLAFSALVQLFTDGYLSGAVRKELNSEANAGVKQFAIDVFSWFMKIKNFFVSIGEGFGKAMEVAGPTFEALGKSLTKLGVALGLVSDANDPESNAANFDTWGKAGEKIGKALAFVLEFLAEQITNVTDFVGGAAEEFGKFSPIVDEITSRLGELYDAFTPILDALGLSTDKTGEAKSGWTKFGEAVGFVGVIIAAVVNVVLVAMTQMVEGVVATFTWVTTYFTAIANVFQAIVDIISGIASGDWAKVWTGMKMVVFNVVKFIVDALFIMIERIAGTIDAAGKLVKKDFGAKKAVQGFKSELTGSLATTLGVEAKVNESIGDSVDTKRQHDADFKKKTGTLPGTNKALPVMPEMPSMASNVWGGIKNAAMTAQAGGGPGKIDLSSLKMPAHPTQPQQLYATLMFDGEVIARAVAKAGQQNSSRTFQPTTVPG